MKRIIVFTCSLLFASGLTAQSLKLEDQQLLTFFLDANAYDRKVPKQELRDYDSTHTVSSTFSGDFCDGDVSYQLKILQVQSDFDCHYKMLFYTDNTMLQDFVAIRLGGYLENDFIHFYERVLRHYLSGKKATAFLADLQKDPALNGIDFPGLVQAVHSGKREADCMKALEYVHPSAGFVYASSSANWEQTQKEQLIDNVYAYFSNRPFYGMLPPKGKYRRR